MSTIARYETEVHVIQSVISKRNLLQKPKFSGTKSLAEMINHRIIG
jgi:hypothetical protein